MNRNPITIIIVLVLVIFGGWFFLSGNMAGAPFPVATNQTPVVGSPTPEMIVENENPDVTVVYSDAGFSPKSVTVPVGTKVIFVNQSTENMWVASAKHPDHTVYSGTSLSQHCPDTSNSAFDECAADAPGKSYSFIFNKEGEWKYHDHIGATKFGSVIVTGIASSTPSTAPQQN